MTDGSQTPWTKERRKAHSEAMEKYWRDLSPKDYKERGEEISERNTRKWDNLSTEERQERRKGGYKKREPS